MAFVSVGPPAHDDTVATMRIKVPNVPMPAIFVPRRLTLIAQECKVFIRSPAAPCFVPIRGSVEDANGAYPQPFTWSPGVFSVVGTSRCDVRAARSGATPSNASAAWSFVPPATTRAGTAWRSSSQNPVGFTVFSLSSVRWRRGTGRGGAFCSEFPSPRSSPHSFLMGRGGNHRVLRQSQRAVPTITLNTYLQMKHFYYLSRHRAVFRIGRHDLAHVTPLTAAYICRAAWVPAFFALALV